MINSINTELYNIQQISVSEQTVTAPSQAEKKSESTKEGNAAVELKLSQQVLNQINNTISTEDILTRNLNTARIIYDSLGSIKTELADLVLNLRNPEIEHDAESLEDLEAKSNVLIEKVISTIRNHDKTGLVKTDLLNIYFNGLNSLKELKIQDNDYLSKISLIEQKIEQEKNNYFKTAEELYNKTIQNSKEFEELNKTATNASSKEIQTNIVQQVNETLQSVCNGLTPETVMRLLNNK